MDEKTVLLVLTIGLIIGAGAGYGLSDFYVVQPLEIAINDVRQQLSTSQNMFNELNTDYSTLNVTHGILITNYKDSLDNWNVLNFEYTSLQDQYNSLQEQKKQFQQSNNELSVVIENLILFYEGFQGVPAGYFDVNVFPLYDNTVNQLVSFLDSGLLKQKAYQVSVFNCSESAAYVEWALDDAGFNAVIATGTSPWSIYSNHAWVIVYTIEQTVAIEANKVLRGEGSKSIVYVGDTNWDNYYNGYRWLFEDIFEALQYYSIRSWNWWDGCWGICD